MAAHVTARGASVEEDYGRGNWRERESDTQARSREDNEATAREHGRVADDGRRSWFRCECGDPRCTWAICLTAAEYESVRAYPTHFAIARNHDNPETEQLVEEHARFAVVEIVSADAVKRARRSDPRSRVHVSVPVPTRSESAPR